MYRNVKRFRAFTTGCLLSALTLGPTSQLLANTPEPDEIQGVTSTYQEAPATPSEFDDVVTGINAGMDAGSLITPAPDPIREHTAFLASMWKVLFDSEYQAGTSYLSTGAWVSGSSGTVVASNENGASATVEVLLSMEILPDIHSAFDSNTRDLMANLSARCGVAWTEMSNTSSAQANLLVWWYQWTPDGSNAPVTAIGPINTVSDEELDLLRFTIPLMGDFFEDPHNYNINNYDPSILGVWSDFRSAVKSGYRSGAAIVASALATGAVTVGYAAATATSATAAATVGSAVTAATVTIYTGITVGIVITVMTIEQAKQDLRQRLEDLGFDTSSMSDDDVQALAEILINV